MERVTLTIDGMSCGHCVAAVSKALESLSGVDVEQVTIGQAVVKHDPTTTPSDALVQAIEDEGYGVVSSESASAR